MSARKCKNGELEGLICFQRKNQDMRTGGG